jgi:hypothetical protein
MTVNQRKYLLLPFLFLPYLLAQAQKPPGYQGRRLSLEFGVYAHPDFGGRLISNLYGFPQPKVSITRILYSESVGINYVYSRRSSLGVSFQLFAFNRDLPAVQFLNPAYHFSGNARVISIYKKQYGRNADESIAPLGRYVRPELNFLFYSGSLQTDAGKDGNGMVLAPTSTSFHSSLHIGFSYSIGRSYVLFNRITLDRGIRFSTNNLGHAFYAQRHKEFYPQNTSDPAIQEVLGNQAVNLYVSIGWLR